MPQSECMLKYTFISVFIDILYIYIVQFAVVTTMQKSILRTPFSLQKHLDSLASLQPPPGVSWHKCPGRNGSPCPGTEPTVIFKPEGQFYLGHMLSLQKFFSIPSKGATFTMETNNGCNSQHYLLYIWSDLILVFSPNCWNFSYLVYWYFTVNIRGN